ncbi:MAG: ATPase [Rubrivivax sp.]|nr:MAG: ATPase [Rubrivivax sp.]
MAAARGTVVAVVGAESTGKTTLVHELVVALRGRGLDAVVVTEALRDFCDRQGRTPHMHEQAGIAFEQSRRIAEAAGAHAIVLADTTALMIAVYSDHIFGDRSLYAQAEQDHALADLTLLTSLDLPWVADGLQRDGPHVREPVDALIRRSLARTGTGFAVVQGDGGARVDHAMAAVQHLLEAPGRAARALSGPRWRWVCERCDDAACEQHLFPRPERP